MKFNFFVPLLPKFRALMNDQKEFIIPGPVCCFGLFQKKTLRLFISLIRFFKFEFRFFASFLRRSPLVRCGLDPRNRPSNSHHYLVAPTSSSSSSSSSANTLRPNYSSHLKRTAIKKKLKIFLYPVQRRQIFSFT